MKTSTRLYGWLKLLTGLHVVEQLIFGMEDLHQLQHMIVVYERWFGNTNTAIAMLVIGGISLFSSRGAFSSDAFPDPRMLFGNS
ncbi:MAG TPA: hypothetical protein VFO39_17625 [Candidatus Sulfotelmatobacter sp.]|nr:hypothetical protein [Candidatus Sulfotelmatobacter sp.]